MEKGIYFLVAFFVIKIVSSQKCPSYWYGYSSTSKCYRFMYNNKLSWQDARDICQLHGGDLLKIDSIPERTWIFGQIAHLKNHSKIPSDKWWVGLNNREFLSTWEWADGSQIASNVVNWAPGEPNNKGGTERCGEINTNIFNDQECTDVNRYICSRNRGLPLACDTDHSWQTLNGQCYKVYTAKTSWNSANQRCQHDGGSMVTIGNQNDETVMHDFAVNFKQQLWIGLHSVQQSGSTFQWTWFDNTPLFTAYWHGTPHVDRHNLNSSCVALSNTATKIQAWTVQPCSQTRAYVCRKPEGVCFPGWIGHAGSCYQFNAQFRQSFASASTFCRNQGAELLRYTGSTTTLFINSYLQEMKDSGAGDFWIGASDNNTNGGPYKWRNGQTVTYKWWATANNIPTNTAGKQDCAYVSTSDKNGKWRTTSNCGTGKAFVCLIPMGATVKPILRTPRPHYGCPSNWHRYGSLCYRIYDQAVDWLTARSRCQQTGGADLAAIRSQGAQNFVNHYAAPGIQYWIGLNDRIAEGVYVWNDENNPTTFTSWQPHQPNNYGQTQNCVVLVDSKWGDYPCSNKKRYVCYKSANSILPPQPAPTIAVDWTVKCGPGWESNPITANCYMFVDEPLSWIDALNQCQRFHGNLVAIETLEEQNYLAGRIQTMNSIGLWIGANDRSTEGGWKWSSGKPFAFLNWAGGQPAAKGQGTDCVVMFTQNAQWDDVNCIQRNGYVCEKVGNVPTTKAPATTTKKVPAGMVLGCHQGWKPYGTNCYYFGRTSYTWMDAYTRCGRLSAKLASIQSKNEQDFITGNLWKNPKKSWDGVWIGLNDRQSESRFQWSDGSDVKYTKWDVGEPNSWRNHNEDCVEVYLNNSNWNDELCSARLGGYICKAPKIFVSATQSPYQIGCPRYAIGYESHCYRIITSLKTRTDANNYCNRTYHGTLATVNNRFIQGFLSSQLLYRTGYFWLGMSDSATPGTYTWASGDRVLYTNWHNTHTGNENATCVGMRADQPIGLWENLACTRKSGYICQLPRTSGFSTMPTTPTPYPNVPCPTGWTAVQGNCYYAFTGKTHRLTWMNARTFCKSLGGELPSFHGGLNDSFLSTFLPTDGNPVYWIGINDRDTEAGYIWSDGTAVDYTNWMPEEPNNYKGNEDCAMYYTRYKQWNDMSCYTTQNYICVVPRGAQLPATTVIPPPSRSPQCGSNPNWYFYNNNCYMLNPTSGPNATLSWYDANDYCNGINAHLASIHTNDENSFLEGLVNTLSLSSYWIGLNELGLNGYSWTDTTPVDFILWMRGEPNDYYGGERCGELYALRGGRWNDDNCGRKRAYICKKPVSGQVIISTAAPYPSGGCANGFTRVPGGRNKCFYMNTNKLNWTAARDHCREFGKGYDIASIEDIYEQDFFMSMAASQTNSFWIGLTDRVNNNVFLWQDNSPVVFTHWDSGQPTSSHSQSKTKERDNCVIIRMFNRHEGKWADVDCARNFSSLCQAKQDPNLPINPAPGNCRSGYMPYGQGCYKISSDVKSWSDARAACQSEGGDLTSVNNIYESGFVFTLGSTKAPFWIGLSDSKTHGLYGWSDGWPVKFTNWGLRQPSYSTNGGCVVVNSNDKWDDVDCSKQQNYVCKITAVRPPASTPPPPGNCSNPNWIPNGGYCYSASVNNGRSWPEANFQCRKSGMELVSVHSKAEMDFVFNLVTQAKVTDPQNKPNIWLGLSKGAQGGLAVPGSSAGQQQSNTGIGGSGLSGGSVAGIVLGIIIVIILIVFILVLLSRKGIVKVPKFDGAAGFENKLYNIRNSFAKNESDT